MTSRKVWSAKAPMRSLPAALQLPDEFSMTPAIPPVTLPVDINQIRALLPHRFPFLLVDRVVELEPHRRIKAYKNVTINEPCFQGHFPDLPIMPGVLIIEAMAQAAGLLTRLSEPPPEDGKAGISYLVKVDKARFSKMVLPGDQIVFEVTMARMLRRMALYECRATVDGNEVATAEILCAEPGSGRR